MASNCFSLSLNLLSSKCFCFHGILSDRTCKACDGLNPRCTLTSQLNPQKEETHTQKQKQKKALGPTQILCEHVHVCQALRVQSSPQPFGCCWGWEGGRGTAQLPLQSAGPRQPQAASAHIHTQPNHTSTAPSMPTGSQSGPRPLISSWLRCFLIHYMTALWQFCLTPRTDTYFVKRGIL